MRKIFISHYQEEDINIWSLYETEVYTIIKKLRLYYKCKKSIFILLTNTTGMIELNKKYRNIEKNTNVIALEMNDELCLGEIILSFNQIYQEFNNHILLNDSLINIYDTIYESFHAYLFFIISHGFLHLLGYDHNTDEEELIMNQEQEKLFKIRK